MCKVNILFLFFLVRHLKISCRIAHAAMKTSFLFLFFVFLYVGLSDDIFGNAIDNAIWGAGEAAVDAGGAVLNKIASTSSGQS